MSDKATNRHIVQHHPISGTGQQVCECGATRRVESGTPHGDWHACQHCVMMHKYGGEICNQPESDAAVKRAKAVLAKMERGDHAI